MNESIRISENIYHCENMCNIIILSTLVKVKITELLLFNDPLHDNEMLSTGQNVVISNDFRRNR